MEESGENWPCDSGLEAGVDVIFEEGEFVCDDDDDDDGHSFSETETGDHTKGELSKRLMALSATIPGLKKMKKKKMDDSCILDKASNYVKKLQKRVRELEEEVESSKGTTSCEVNYNDILLPEIKARVLQNEVLVIIHCEKQKGIMLKILTHLQNLHLSIVSSTVLRFGKSTLDITIIAQMGDGYKMAVDELVKSLRKAISAQ